MQVALKAGGVRGLLLVNLLPILLGGSQMPLETYVTASARLPMAASGTTRTSGLD
jgi:hypothetical protein